MELYRSTYATPKDLEHLLKATVACKIGNISDYDSIKVYGSKVCIMIVSRSMDQMCASRITVAPSHSQVDAIQV